MPDIGQEIWANWTRGSGQCDGCPNRDCNGFFTPKTIETYGYLGDPDPDLLLVADTPGDNHPEDSKHGDEKRLEKDSPNDGHHSNRMEKKYEDEVNGRSIDWLIGKPTTQIPPLFFERAGCDLVRDESNEVVQLSGAHYINAKKCADIYPKQDARVENDVARYRCRVYTAEQITELDPDVIVALGAEAFREVTKVLGHDVTVAGNLKDFIKRDGQIFTSYGKSLPVIPTYHFRTIWRTYGKTDDFDDPREYWKVLGERTKTVISENSD